MGYKGKKAQKTLNTSFYIWYIGDKKMKQVRVQNVTYYIESEDELIDLAHRLVKEGYSVSQIAQFLGVTERKVKKMMEDCW